MVLPRILLLLGAPDNCQMADVAHGSAQHVNVTLGVLCDRKIIVSKSNFFQAIYLPPVLLLSDFDHDLRFRKDNM